MSWTYSWRWDLRWACFELSGMGASAVNFMLPTNVFIWVKSIPICVQSWNSPNRQTNLWRNVKVTCHNFLFPGVLANWRALDWARINPVIKPWQSSGVMMEPDTGDISHYHRSLHLWSQGIWVTQKISQSHVRTCPEYWTCNCSFHQPWHWFVL